MRTLHRPVAEGVLRSLHGIFEEGRPADKVIQFHLKQNRKWGSQDRRLFAESVYDLVRWWRKLLHVTGVEWPAEDAWRKPVAPVAGRALAVWCALNEVELKGAPREDESALRAWNDPDLPRAVRESIPDWLDAWASEQLGARWDELLPVLNTVAPVYLRANRLKTTPEKLLARLEKEGYSAELAGEDALRLVKRANVFLSASFRDGLFEVQDLHSQRVGPELGAKAGERVIDACAGAGGKSLHLAALMGNKGKIVAMDVAERKLENLRERSRRAGASSIETRFIENRKVIKRLEASADRLLLDVPCTGLGVLRRNPDSKWKLNPSEIETVAGLQREILEDYVRMLKPGGTLIYATCSIMPRENGDRVREFLSRHETEFRLEHEETLWPERDGGDGFYFARLTKS